PALKWSAVSRTLILAAAFLVPSWSFAQGDCSVPGQNLFVRNTLQNYYLWYQQLPDPNPALFDSPEAYLEAVRYRPIDTTFSFITSQAANDAFFSDSQFIGLGISTKLVGPAELRLADVFPDGPAAEAGLERGDQILAIDGVSLADIVARDQLGSAFGPSDIGFTVHLRFRHLSGAEAEADITKRVVTIPTVGLTRVYEVDGRKVGYVVFKNFVEPSVAALDAAFTQLGQEGATELILDLRYNGGGLLSVAQHLGSLIGGMRTNAQVFATLVYNDKNTGRNQVYRFDDPRAARDFSRAVVITTRGSASASETVINSLRPFIPVVTVGDTSYGKPVGQIGFNFCGKVLFPVAFSVRNSANQGDYFGGLPADCPAPDDLDHAFGDPQEGSLAEALHYLQAGACSAAAAASRAKLQARLPRGVRAPHTESGWQQLLGAY
ncbi:MAG TPA: S41 family peptidase, partial [Vicinamibacteria bacterium]